MTSKRIHEPRTPVELRAAWKKSDPRIERDAELFWQREGLLVPETDVSERLTELCMAGYDGERLIALSTARVVFTDFLGVKLVMLRIATAREARQNRLGTYLLASSREHLEAWSAAHPEEEVMGMGTITQTTAYDARGPARAFLRDSRLGFIGFTGNGEHMRVAWFEHGRIPLRRPDFPATFRGTLDNG